MVGEKNDKTPAKHRDKNIILPLRTFFHIVIFYFTMKENVCKILLRKFNFNFNE